VSEQSINLNVTLTAYFEIIRFLKLVFEEFEQINKREHHGGYFTIADVKTGAPLLIKGIGHVLPEKFEKYAMLSQEKARRLASHPDHVTSAQSRDPDQMRYAGAVSAKNYIFSFSGMDEEHDEALCLSVAFKLSLLNDEEVRKNAGLWTKHA
jgi:hypothetical protein